jgi:HD superfamily phosphodiesterase
MNPQLTCSYSDKRKYWRLWRLAKPYLDTRENDTHTRISVELALRLLGGERGAPQVVLPAVILHDVGWNRVPEELQLKAFGPRASSPELNRLHEVEGVKIARSLLNQVSYDPSLACEILAIIDGHDSRNLALSRNDAVVKDADKLWRYTKAGFEIDTARFDETVPEGLTRLEDHIEDWFLTASGQKYARALFHQRAQDRPSEARAERRKDG